ncbi:flagellar motor switch protein FliM [Pseudarthrobacter sp. NPDC092424]|uniref:flagellar motor switch protein FliM n=1 Tax=Pseudarthrobacter sp. NPDC092424 TaxID=3364415 RepID=UPI0037FB52EF
MSPEEMQHMNPRGRAPRTVEVYDFRRPTTLAREHSRILELAFETFARQWGTQLTAKVRVKSQVTFGNVLMQTYDAYAASLPSTTAMVLCRLEGLDSKAVIQFPTAAGLAWVGRMLGGNGSRTAPERKFTQIEHSLVRRLMEDALEDLRYSLGTLMEPAISLESIQHNSQFAQAAATTDLMIVAAFSIRVGEDAADATIAMPAEVLLSGLGAANPTVSAENSKEMLLEQLGYVPVDVSLSLTPASVRPSTVLNLAVGDLVPLPHPTHRPLDITVEGRALAQAAPGANGARLAAVIVNTQETRR